jgi:hypothetical protein
MVVVGVGQEDGVGADGVGRDVRSRISGNERVDQDGLSIRFKPEC